MLHSQIPAVKQETETPVKQVRNSMPPVDLMPDSLIDAILTGCAALAVMMVLWLLTTAALSY